MRNIPKIGIVITFLLACSSMNEEIRQPRDLVGYTHTGEGIAKVVAHAEEAEKEGLLERGGDPLIGAVSPHDDYAYAQRVYVHAYPQLRARHVILVGVAHRARDFPQCEGKLVFDSFHSWHGPYSNIPVSPLREDLLRALEPDDAMVLDELQVVEHSLEGMVPFLQHYNRKAEIVPILVPYMSWERLRGLAERTADALHDVMTKKKLVPGEDVAILISSDSVHYGDRGWGGREYADFGTDGKGYDKAVERDLELIRLHLTGRIDPEKVEGFYRKVLKEDYHEYRITWCGRFSIPFGLVLLSELAGRSGRPAPWGELLRYGTTLDPGRSDPGVEGLGVTAEANLHHWVGFCAIAYR